MKGSRVRSVGLGVLVVTLNVALVALVAMGVSQRGFSGWWATLRGEWTPVDAAVKVEDPFASTDDSVITTHPPAEDDSVTTTAPPTRSAPPEPPSVAERFEDGEDLTVLVLGDLMGTHENDWPAAWARMLSADRTVQIYPPLAEDPTRYSDPLILGGGASTVSIYNSSLYDGTPAYAAKRLSLLAPEEPDVVLLSYGRANTPDDLPGGLNRLWKAVDREFPDAESHVIVEPPRLDGLAPTTDATRQWAEDHDAPVIDVARVFEDEGIIWATQSMRDPLAVNIYGGERWAQIVQEAVFGGPVQGGEQDGSDVGADATSAADLDPVDVQPTEPVWQPPAQQPPVQEQPPPVWTPPPWQPVPTSPTGPTTSPTETAPAPTLPTEEPSPPTSTEPTEPAPTDGETEPADPSGTDSFDLPGWPAALWS